MIKLKKLLYENPNVVRIKNSNFYFEEDDAVTFVYNLKTKKYFSANKWTDGFEDVRKIGITHLDLFRIYNMVSGEYNSKDFINGRYWKNSMIISIWELKTLTYAVMNDILKQISKEEKNIYKYKIDTGTSYDDNYTKLVPVKLFMDNLSLYMNTMDKVVDTQRLPHIIPIQKLTKDELDLYLVRGIITKTDYDREISRRKSAPIVYKPANY
jgi:hypothetical protein